jgi:protein-arginine kinase activator protein McsA
MERKSKMDCQNCDSNKAKLRLIGDDEYIKLCDECYKKLNKSKAFSQPPRHKMIEKPERAKGHNIPGYTG